MAYSARKAEPGKTAFVMPEMPSLAQRIEWVDDWEEKTRDSREKAVRDRQYYDGIQWTREEIDELEERNQPVLTKNRIARKVNFILGEEIEKRVDPVAKPKTPQHEDAARAATDALRYVEEEQDFDEVRSQVFKNVIVEGYGGAIKELEEEQNDDGTAEYKHLLRHVEWDRLGYDPHSRVSDFSDGRYKFILTWMDLDEAISMYPEAEASLNAAMAKEGPASTAETAEDTPRLWVDGKRKRVKICEMYFRIGKNWFRSDFTECGDLLPCERTAYLDEKRRYSMCPLIMASCYIDRNGFRYGIVRQLISPQDDFNKRNSKALDVLIRHPVIAERDAVANPQEFQTEIAKADGYAEVEPNALAEGRIQLPHKAELAQGHVQLMQEAKQDIDSIGPSASNLPDIPESASGRAFLARQRAASKELGPVFSSLRRWTKQVFMLDWLCIRMVWTEEKWLRVTDDQELNGYRFTALNQRMTRAQRLQELMSKQPAPPLPKAVEIAVGEFAPMILAAVQQQHQAMMQQAQGAPPQVAQQLQSPDHMLQMVMQHPAMMEQITVNQVEQMGVDIVIDEAPDTAVIEEEEFSKLSEIIPTVIASKPDMGAGMVKLLIKASQLRNKRELLQELEKGPSPEEQKQQQAVRELQVKGAAAKVAVDESAAQLNVARAQSEQASAAKVPSEIEKNQATAMHQAAHAGQKSVPPMPEGPMT